MIVMMVSTSFLPVLLSVIIQVSGRSLNASSVCDPCKPGAVIIKEDCNDNLFPDCAWSSEAYRECNHVGCQKKQRLVSSVAQAVALQSTCNACKPGSVIIKEECTSTQFPGCEWSSEAYRECNHVGCQKKQQKDSCLGLQSLCEPVPPGTPDCCHGTVCSGIEGIPDSLCCYVHNNACDDDLNCCSGKCLKDEVSGTRRCLPVNGSVTEVFNSISKLPRSGTAGLRSGWESAGDPFMGLGQDAAAMAIDVASIILGGDGTPTAAASGAPVNVWGAVDTLHRCGSYIASVPDIPARAYVDTEGLTHMIVGSTSYHHMNGASILNVTRECASTWNLTADPDPAHFAGNEFLDSPIAFENGTVVALVHTEYPGGIGIYNNSGPNAPECPYGNDQGYPKCWTVTIGLAISHDWGKTWGHAAPPPHHLVASVPYKYNSTQLASGWGDPSNILRHPKDGHYYAAIWNRNQVGLQRPGICMMRTSNLLDPASWRAWDGKAYTRSFVSPYSMEPGTEAAHICVPTNLPAGSCVPIKGEKRGCQAAGLVWSTYLEKFVVTLGCGPTFQWATSDDLITWSEPQPLDVKRDMPSSVSKMVVAMNYPTFMDPTAPVALGDRNFYTIGQTPYLFWASIGHSPHSDGRHQWATPFRFQK